MDEKERDGLLATNLLLMDFKGVTILHIQLIWTICSLNTAAVEEEANGVWCFALSFAESIHQLLQLSGTLDLEEDFIIVVGNLDVQVLGNRAYGFRATWTALVVGHYDFEVRKIGR